MKLFVRTEKTSPWGLMLRLRHKDARERRLRFERRNSGDVNERTGHELATLKDIQSCQRLNY